MLLVDVERATTQEVAQTVLAEALHLTRTELQTPVPVAVVAVLTLAAQVALVL